MNNKIKVFRILITIGLLIGAVGGLFIARRFLWPKTSILKMVDVRGNKITVKLITDNFSENEPLIRAVFEALYKKNPAVFNDAIKQFKTIDALTTFAIKTERDEFVAKKQNFYFVHALIDKKPVGYLSFEVQPDKTVFMRELMIDPAYQGMGIGKLLTHTIFDIRPDVTKITLITGRSNSDALGFYKHLGFVEGPIPQTWADPKSWVGMEFTKVKN